MVYEVLQNKWVRAIGLLGAIIVISVVLYLMSSVLVPLFFAFIVAYVFDPVIDKIETYKISRVGSIVTLVGGLTLASIIVPLMVLPSVIRQANSMMGTSVDIAGGEADSEMKEAQQEKEAFREKVAHTIEDWLELDTFVRVMGWADEVVESPPVDPRDLENSNSQESVPSAEVSAAPETDVPIDLDSFAIIRHRVGVLAENNAESLMRSLFPKWKDAGTSVLRMLSIVGDTFLSMFLFIGNFVLFAFVAIYLLKDYDHIVAHGDRLVPHRHRPKVREVMGRIDTQLRSFLRGQFVVCCCLGSMYAVGFYISGVPFALLLALFGAVASFVPYLGMILTIGPAVILTIIDHGGFDWHLAGLLITFAIAQFLEGNFLTPKIVGTSVGLGPVWVILAIMIFSSAFGFLGLLLAVPIAAVMKVLAEEALNAYRTSNFYSGDDPAPSS